MIVQKYRYWLERDKGSNPLVFVMLNPSTADAELDDPTIRRCRRFAADNGYTGIVVVNLYAYRATKPKDLFSADDPIGQENDNYISTAALINDVCCAWGANADKDRAAEVVKNYQGCRWHPSVPWRDKRRFTKTPFVCQSRPATY